MIRILRLSVVIAVCLFPFSVQAEPERVQVDLEVLESYTPPPMFGNSSAKPAKQKKQLVELKEKDILQPSAAEILKQVESRFEDNKKAVSRKRASKAPPSPKMVRIEAEKKPDHTLTENVKPGFFEMEFPLAGASDDLTQAKQVLSERFLGDLKAWPDSRIEIRSYASPEKSTPSEARRLSLKNAIALRDYLVAQNIDLRRIDLLPLGDLRGASGGQMPKNKLEFAFRPR